MENISEKNIKKIAIIGGSAFAVLGLCGLISNAYYYYYTVNLKAGEHPEAPIYNFKFKNFPEKSRPMTIYEASLKKDIQLSGNIDGMQLSGIVLLAGLSTLIWGMGKTKSI